MSLSTSVRSKPVRRKHAHRRTVMCDGYEREDGLWDIEANIKDVKSETVDNPDRGYVTAGEAFHHMTMRFTIDKQFKIHQVEAVIKESPFHICPKAAGTFKRLEGTRIGPGWHRQAKELVGGVQGCTHLFELLPVLATTAVQSLWPSLEDDVMSAGSRVMLNTCRSWAQNSDVVRRLLPDLYDPNYHP